jgi:pyruvate formate lyase activating enzyme
MTLSGGEPMFQPEFAISLMEKCKESGISTCMETSGFFDKLYLHRLVNCCDLFLWDIKDTDQDRHKRYTGVYPERIVNNLKAADALGAKIIIRCILVHSVNDDNIHAENIRRLASDLKNCIGVDILPYHAFGGSKSSKLGLKDNGIADWIPSDDNVLKFREIVKKSVSRCNILS